MEIVEKKVSELKAYENNPRKNDNAVEAVANSIREFGFKVPIVIDSNDVIVCGHTRLKAAIQLGMEKVPCIVASDLSEEQIKAFRLADNKTNELAEWDLQKLYDEVINIENISVEDFGFNIEEIEISLEKQEYENDTSMESGKINDGNAKPVTSGSLLRWDRKTIPMTEDEVDCLNQALEDYQQKTGLSYGFVRDLLCNMSK